MTSRRTSGRWQPVRAPWNLDLTTARPADPYLLWAALIGFSTSLEEGEGLLPFLFHLGPDWHKTLDRGPAPALGPLETAFHGHRLDSHFLTAMLPRESIELLWVLQGQGVLRRFQLGAARGSPREPSAPVVELGTLAGLSTHTLGVVDDGCALAHEGWRTPDGLSTRLVAVWDQQPDATVDQHWQVYKRPAGSARYGVELSGSKINALLVKHPGLGEIAEREIYREIGRATWGRPGRTHGARVMNLLCGRPRPDGDHPPAATPGADSPLVFVQLPAHTASDTSGGSIGFYVLDGVRYIVDTARLQAQGSRDWRCTVVLSVGSLGGPHDGSAIVDQALAELVAQEGKRVNIVAAAGNAADQRLHAQRTVTAGKPARFELLAAPDNPRESFVELWMSPELAASATLCITTPDGRRASGMRQGQVYVLRDANGLVTAALVFAARVPQGETGTMALLAVMPTAPTSRQTVPLAPAGVWSIDVETTRTDPLAVHAWIERNDTLVGTRAPQRTRFLRSHHEPERRADEASTMSSLAHGDRVISAGGYVVKRQAAANYSGRGPALAPGDPKPRPDYFGPSDSADSLPGVRVPGFFSGQWRRMSGTSAATPRVARWLAFERDPVSLVEVQEPPDAQGVSRKRRNGVPP